MVFLNAVLNFMRDGQKKLAGSFKRNILCDEPMPELG